MTCPIGTALACDAGAEAISCGDHKGLAWLLFGGDDRAYSGGGFASSLPTVGDLIRGASLDAISVAANLAHQAGDIPLRTLLAARWNAAVDAGAGWAPGIVGISHDRAPGTHPIYPHPDVAKTRSWNTPETPKCLTSPAQVSNIARQGKLSL